jgi:hypothetical protein
MHQFHKFTLVWKSTCFEQFLCPSSGVNSLYTQQWHMSYMFLYIFFFGFLYWCVSFAYLALTNFTFVWPWFVTNFFIIKPNKCTNFTNSWWWTEELPETFRVSCQSEFVKLVQLVVFIIKKFVTMHGHTNVKCFKYETRCLSYQYCHTLYIHSWSTATYLGFVLYYSPRTS